MDYLQPKKLGICTWDGGTTEHQENGRSCRQDTDTRAGDGGVNMHIHNPTHASCYY